MNINSVHMTERNLTAFLFEFHARKHSGMLVFGQSQGSGKTSTVVTMMQIDLEAGRNFTFITPATGCGRLINHAQTLPARIRKRLNAVRPADGLGPVPNGLYWEDEAEIPAKCEFMVRIVRKAYGDIVTEQASPNIDTYMYFAFKATAIMQLPMVMAPAFLDVTFPQHKQLIAAVKTFDLRLGYRLADIREMSRTDYTAIVVPALKRLETCLLENPVVRDMLANANTPPPEFLLESVNLIDLSPRDRQGRMRLRRTDRRLFYGLWGGTLLQAPHGLDDAPEHTVWFDEFHNAEGIFEECQTNLAEAAKYNQKQSFIDQSLSNFAGGPDAPIIQAAMENCPYHLIGRLQSPLDSEFFSMIPHVMTWHRRKVKHVLKRMEQFDKDQPKIIETINRAHNWSDVQTAGQDQGETEAEGENEEETDTINETQDASETAGDAVTDTDSKNRGNRSSTRAIDRVTPDGDLITADSTGSDSSEGTGTAHAVQRNNSHTKRRGGGRARGRARGRNRNRGRKHGISASQARQDGGSISGVQHVLAQHGWREVIQSIDFLNDGEQHLQWKQKVMWLHTGHFLCIASGQGIAHFRFDMPVDQIDRAPRFIAAERKKFFAALLRRPSYLNDTSGQYQRLLDDLAKRLPQFGCTANALLLSDQEPELIDPYIPDDYDGLI